MKTLSPNQEYFLFADPKKETARTESSLTRVILGEDVKRSSPVIVKEKGAENHLTQVSFYNNNDKNSLEKKERIEVQKGNIIEFTYGDVNIISSQSDISNDDITKVKELKEIDYKITKKTNKYKVNENVASENMVLDVVYRINNSYIIKNTSNYGYVMDIFTEYDEVEYIYETNTSSPFYLVEDIDVSPHAIDYTSGFLFITDKEYEFTGNEEKDITFEYPTDTIYIREDLDNTEEMIIKCKITDKFGNPIYTNKDKDRFKIREPRASHGETEFYPDKNDSNTDIYGNVYIKYSPEAIDDNKTEKISLSLRDTVKGETITNSFEINLIPRNIVLYYKPQVAFPYHPEGIIDDNDTLFVIAEVIDNKGEPIKDERPITLSFYKYFNEELQYSITENLGDMGAVFVKFDPPNIERGKSEEWYVEAEYRGNTVYQDFTLVGV